MDQECVDKGVATRALLRPLVFVGGLYLGLSLLLRLVLWWRFGLSEGVLAAKLPLLLVLGVWHDIPVLLFVFGPLAALLCLFPAGWTGWRWVRYLMSGLLYLLLFGMLYLPFVEYFFFEEFDARFNLVAVDYLIYPTEVLVNIWGSYPVAWILLAVAGFALLLHRLLWPHWRRGLNSGCPLGSRLRLGGAWLLLAVIAVLFPGPGFRSGNRVADELAGNGLRSLVQAFCTNELDFLTYYRTIDDNQAFALMRRELALAEVEAPGRDLNRTVSDRADGLGPMNVIVIVEESMGAGFVGAYGDKRGLTPALDRLAAEGLRFSNVFATGTRTVRGLEAITLSLPPIPSESVLKRPGCEGLANWGQVMQSHGYHTSFLYGGYGYFDNMNHFFGTNGFALSDRTDIVAPRFTNIWGVSDEDLLQHALGYFDRQQAGDQLFFSLIMTTSNHRPYTFPEGIPGVPAEGGGRKAGVCYADYALGQFMDKAKQHAWYDNTLFVIVADHDARVYGRARCPLSIIEFRCCFMRRQNWQPRFARPTSARWTLRRRCLVCWDWAIRHPFTGRMF